MQNMKTFKISGDENFAEWREAFTLSGNMTDLLSDFDIDDFVNPRQIQELIDTHNRAISFKRVDYGNFKKLKLNENLNYRFNPFHRLKNCKLLTAKYFYKIVPKIITDVTQLEV